MGYRVYSNILAYILRDKPNEPAEHVELTIQMRYLNDAMGIFLRGLMKVYSAEELTDEDRERLRRHLDRVFDAKDSVTPREPKGGFYPRTY